jgi:hypothetical protein
MGVAEPVSERAPRDRLTIADGFASAARRRVRAGRRPSATLGEVIEAVASESEDDLEVVAVVAHLFHTRAVRWPTPFTHGHPDRMTPAFG